MKAQAVHLPAGSDLRRSLEHLAQEHNSSAFVLSVVGNLSQASFACPGRPEPTVLSGELEIITLQGTISPAGVHLHLSVSDAGCQVWGGHLEHGSLVLRGADLLVGFLEPTGQVSTAEGKGRRRTAAQWLTIAVAEGCPWSARALRMLRTLAIPVQVVAGDTAAELPQLFLDGQPIGGYRELTELHASGDLEPLRHG
jgi:uncharacterized protein